MADMTPTTTAIRTERLSKRYGETLALDALDLTVVPGEVYGYLGPNDPRVEGPGPSRRLTLGNPESVTRH
jgi:ABC-2 type transport system ATP-binding protein